MTIRVICAIFFLSYITPCAYSQNIDSLAHPMNKNGFSISVNFIYNLSANKNINSIDLPLGHFANYNPTNYDTLYLEQYKNIDAPSYGLNLMYNQCFLPKISFSFGLGFNQKSQISKIITYVDSSMYKADLKKEIRSNYAITIPLKITYYYKRLLFSIGNNFSFNINSSYKRLFEDNFQKSYSETDFYFKAYLQESISFQLLKKKGVYIQVSAEQNSNFYRNYGYNNWFMLGATYFF